MAVPVPGVQTEVPNLLQRALGASGGSQAVLGQQRPRGLQQVVLFAHPRLAVGPADALVGIGLPGDVFFQIFDELGHEFIQPGVGIVETECHLQIDQPDGIPIGTRHRMLSGTSRLSGARAGTGRPKPRSSSAWPAEQVAQWGGDRCQRPSWRPSGRPSRCPDTLR
jgi:hypothetical protein